MSISKICKNCGTAFTVERERCQVYCSAKCRSEYNNDLEKQRRAASRAKGRKGYTPRSTHTTICKGCGAEFQGRWNQAYCKSCISGYSWYMQQLAKNRISI